MIHLVLRAFLAACLANFSAKSADRLSELTASSHVAGRHATNLRAVHVELYTSGHTLDILLFQAGDGAVVAFGSAGVTCIDTRLELFMRHIYLQKKDG